MGGWWAFAHGPPTGGSVVMVATMSDAEKFMELMDRYRRPLARVTRMRDRVVEDAEAEMRAAVWEAVVLGVADDWMTLLRHVEARLRAAARQQGRARALQVLGQGGSPYGVQWRTTSRAARLLVDDRPAGFEAELVERLNASRVVAGLPGGREAMVWLAGGGARSGSERARWSRECARLRKEVGSDAA